MNAQTLITIGQLATQLVVSPTPTDFKLVSSHLPPSTLEIIGKDISGGEQVQFQAGLQQMTMQSKRQLLAAIGKDIS